MLFSPTLRYYAEDGADLSESQTVSAVTGVFYNVSERLTLGLGVGFAEQLEDDTEIFPFPIITWQITDNLRLANGEGFAATLGPGIGLFYDIDKQWTLGVLARNSLFRFRLDENGGTPNGVGEDSHTAAYAHIDYNISETAIVSAFAGYQFNGELQLEDQNGRTLADEDYEDSLVFGLFTRIKF